MYGAGDGGSAGWPVQAADPSCTDWVFLDRPEPTTEMPVPYDDAERDAGRIVEALGAGAHLVAHSGGAVAALLAAERAPGRVHSMVLFEPACLGVARDGSAVQAMVADMTLVFDRAADPQLSDVEFTHLFLLAMGAPGADPSDPSTESVGRRLRLSRPPWETPLTLGALRDCPTLVVTGGWSEAFDEVAEVLVDAGARAVVVPGSGHGPHYHRDGHRAMTEFQRGD